MRHALYFKRGAWEGEAAAPAQGEDASVTVNAAFAARPRPALPPLSLHFHGGTATAKDGRSPATRAPSSRCLSDGPLLISGSVTLPRSILGSISPVLVTL